MVPLKIVSNVSRFKPALNLIRVLADLNRGSNSLNSISESLISSNSPCIDIDVHNFENWLYLIVVSLYKWIVRINKVTPARNFLLCIWLHKRIFVLLQHRIFPCYSEQPISFGIVSPGVSRNEILKLKSCKHYFAS